MFEVKHSGLIPRENKKKIFNSNFHLLFHTKALSEKFLPD